MSKNFKNISKSSPGLKRTDLKYSVIKGGKKKILGEGQELSIVAKCIKTMGKKSGNQTYDILV